MKKHVWMWAFVGMVAACGSSTTAPASGDVLTAQDTVGGAVDAGVEADSKTPGPGEDVATGSDAATMSPDSDEGNMEEPVDAAQPIDTAPLADVGQAEDAVDVEAGPDAGTGPDTGTEPDAGAEPDAGTEPDAGAEADAGTADAVTPPDDTSTGVTLVDETTPCANKADCQAGNTCSGWQCSEVTNLCENYWGPADCCFDDSDCDDSNACTKDTCYYPGLGACIHTNNCP